MNSSSLATVSRGSNGKRISPRHPPGDVQQRERFLAQPHDVGGLVREHVARVLVPFDLAADRPSGPVRHPAPVRVEQAAEERFGALGNDLLLPSFELDGPEMLRSRSVLREQARPVLPVGKDRCAADGLDAVHRPARVYRTNGRAGLLDQSRIGVVAGDPQGIDGFAVLRETTIPQVEPEEMCVRRRRWLPVRASRTVARVRPTTLLVSPVTER